MKRAVIYARYSSSSQTEQSIEGQVRVCSEYAKAKGLTITGEYIDRAISGRTDNRPDFQRLMQDCSKHMFEAVIVYRTDRFARNKYDSAIYKRHLRKCGIELHYAAEPIPEGPEGIILESLMEGLAEYYSAELSQKIKRGIRESALKGKATGGNIALGYKIGPDKSFIIDEKEAEAVRMIFDMFVRQKTNAEICEYLNSLGLRTSRGNRFSKSSIPRIIQNEKYIGVYKCGDIRLEDTVPPIVSKEVFLMAQKENTRRRTSKQAALPRAEYLLSGKLFCGHCKKKMTGVSGTGKSGSKFYYYYCPSARYKKGCTKKQVPKDWLEDLVVAETVSHILQPDAVKYIANACYEIQLKDKSKNEEEEFFRRRLADNKKALDNTLKAIESGVDTMTLPARLKELEIERLQLKDGLRAAEAKNIVLTPEHIEFMLMQFAEKGEDEHAYKKEIIECFVSEVYLYDDRLLIYYNINETHPELAESDLSLLESDGFDQRDFASTKIIAGRTQGSTIFVFPYGLVLAFELKASRS
uniref:Integrase n=1 Tax=Dulem virus 37 TaxID=3145755 RepID=A0AAU8AWD9_9CAUD